jgi:hypothetical protein
VFEVAVMLPPLVHQLVLFVAIVDGFNKVGTYLYALDDVGFNSISGWVVSVVGNTIIVNTLHVTG